MKYYIHHVPGRIRIETPVLHDNPVKAKEFEKFVKELNGISAIDMHTITGSIDVKNRTDYSTNRSSGEPAELCSPCLILS